MKTEPNIRVHSHVPADWSDNVARAEPFIVRAAFDPPFSLDVVRKLGSSTQVTVQEQRTGEREQLLLADLVDSLERDDLVRYMSQKRVPRCLEHLLPDDPFPGASAVAGLKKPNFWLGARDAHTGLHRDGYHNVILQLDGTKRFTLLSPRDDECVYPAGPTGMFGNYAGIGSVMNVDLAKFPRFRDASPVECELEPGDILFLPFAWWHEVSTVTPSLMLNYWWPAPPDVVLRRDTQEILRSSEWFLHLLLTATDLSQFPSDHDLVEYLVRGGYVLLAAIILGYGADDFANALVGVNKVDANLLASASMHELYAGNSIEDHAYRLFESIRADYLGASVLLGTPPPYREFNTLVLNGLLREERRKYGLPSWDRICRSNSAWLKNPYVHSND